MRNLKRKFSPSFFIILSLIFIFIISEYLFIDDYKKPKYNISYISSNNSRHDLRFISEGIEQGAKDMNCEVRVNTLLKNTLEEQVNLLESEIKKDIDGIIISPIDIKSIEDLIKRVDKNIPILLINSKINSDKNISYIMSDNYLIGRSLGEEVLSRGNTRKNIIIIEKEVNSIVIDEIKEGFIDEMNYSKNKVVNLKVRKNEDIKGCIKGNKENIIVTFNEDILEYLGNMKKELIENGGNFESEIYGVGRSNNILSYVEDEVIHGIIVENEFNIGYLSVEKIVNKLKNKYTKEKKIGFSVINNRNMYSYENQKLLFPFVK